MIPLRVLFVGLFHAIFGYSVVFLSSCLNPLESMIQSLINDSVQHHYNVTVSDDQMPWFWSSAVSLFAVGAMFAALLVKLSVQKWDKRTTAMVVKNILVILAAALLFCSKIFLSIELLYIGRFVAGMAQCVAGVIAIFIVECVPLRHTGHVSFMCKISHRTWSVIGVLLGLTQTGTTTDNWHWRLLLPTVTSVIHMAGVLVLPKSPKHLYSKDNEEKTLESLSFYHGTNFDWLNLQMSYDEEKKLSQNNTDMGLINVLKRRYTRWPLIICAAATMAAMFAGTDLIQQYSVGIMKNLGLPEEQFGLTAELLLCLPGIGVAIIIMIFINRIGRRRLFLYTMLLSLLGMVVLIVAGYVVHYSKTASAVLAVGSLLVMWICATSGVGTLHTFLPGEMCLQTCNTIVSSVCFFSDWSMSFFTVFAYPLFEKCLGPLALLPFIIIGAVMLIFMYKYMPETTNKTPAEIAEQWKDRTVDGVELGEKRVVIKF